MAPPATPAPASAQGQPSGGSRLQRLSDSRLLERIDRLGFWPALWIGAGAGLWVGLGVAVSAHLPALLTAGFVALVAVLVGISARPRVEWVRVSGREPLLKMLPIPAGRFLMGSPDDDPSAFDDEKPQHKVQISAFEMAETPTTRGQYSEVMGEAPGAGEADLPVARVTWYDAVDFCNRLSKREGLRSCYRAAGNRVSCDWRADGYRLPTEAEWEYAARAGTTTRWSCGDDAAGLEKVAWYSENSGGRLQPVGRLGPNRWGLRDLHGNVFEWCWDRFGRYSSETAKDPTAPFAGEGRITRGGSVGDDPRLLRSSLRQWKPAATRNDRVGFRCVRRPSAVRGSARPSLPAAVKLADNWKERASQYAKLPEQLGNGEAALELLDRLRQATRNGNDLYFLFETVRETARLYPDVAELAEWLERRFFDHIPAPAKGLFSEVKTRGGRVPLWCEIPAGSFLMGSQEGEGDPDERPQREVTIDTHFRLGAVAVTNRQYAAFDPEHPSREWEGVAKRRLADHPVIHVSWYAASTFCRWLAQASPKTAGARLPSEAEWEYACRAGTTTRYWSGDTATDLERVGWYKENSDGRTHRVGRKDANPWGLYDVHGNVWEWTATPWSRDYSDKAVEEAAERERQRSRLDPGGGGRVVRGGSFVGPAGLARSAYRGWGDPRSEGVGRGFRVLLPAPSSDLGG